MGTRKQRRSPLPKALDLKPSTNGGIKKFAKLDRHVGGLLQLTSPNIQTIIHSIHSYRLMFIAQFPSTILIWEYILVCHCRLLHVCLISKIVISIPISKA
jgi:hypothetical protein